MNILFLSMSRFTNLEQRGIYPDLLREFIKRGHNVCVVSPAERYLNEATALHKYSNYSILRVKVGNIQKTNIIEKGISTLLIEQQFTTAIKKYYNNIKFDLVMYSTPPITFANVIEYVKRRDNAKSYLLLKDIFPQNAVDIGMMQKTGLKSIIYKMFRKKEEKLYKVSDYIGCMSQANVDYVIKYNKYIDASKVHISPNCIEVIKKVKSEQTKLELRNKYNIPIYSKVFVYGGNLGKPQDIPFVIECLKANEGKADRFFVICGTGTEYPKLKKYMDEHKPDNVLLINGLPKDEYEDFILSCDVGLVFLDHRFTIPNFPSRLLAYMQNSMPVLACTDVNTDVGKVIKDGDFGWWCESNNANNFTKLVDYIIGENLEQKGVNGYDYLKNNYTAEIGCGIILNCIENEKVGAI